MEKLKNYLFSEKGMTVVNVLFFVAVIIGNGSSAKNWLLFAAYTVWLVYLVFCAKNAPSKGTKIIYCVLIGIVAALILLGLFVRFR